MFRIKLDIKFEWENKQAWCEYELDMPFVPFEGLELWAPYDSVHLITISKEATYIWDEHCKELTISQDADIEESRTFDCIEDWIREFYLECGWKLSVHAKCDKAKLQVEPKKK
ncbi:hypothetical protein [Sulfuricurvum sp.]|uniref:hypothetical protein n=1 Tax=Sulfuricurvum sp. TaxID=2025608 RepID=UPI003566559C